MNIQTSSQGDSQSVEGYDWLMKFDPEFERARRALTAVVWAPERGALPLRIREIVATVALSFMADPAAETHIRRALAAGAKFREVVEALQTVCVPGGHPCLHHAMPYLKEIEKEIGDKANEGAPAGTAQPAKTGKHALTVWPWMQKHYPAYEEARGKLTGMMWTPTDPVLAVKYRELCASMILALRFYPTVPVHMRRALREGLTFPELVEAVQTVALLAGMPILHFCLPFLREIQEEIESGKFS